ncbi:acyl-CoA dehydrogenase family protein [Emcibacter sp. SYSU 3D8]|uniref:acyl-CoA dehydrogenase family protein n=1 Tax=Emcibacter sp. SYSU 3D8 TaxID=3133969 RepID=UPI0031FE4D41
MNFEFSDDQKLLKEQARGFLASKCSAKEVRRILDGNEPYHPELWKGVAEMGWLGASIPEEYGGLGLGYLELCVIAEELGRAVAPIPFSSTVYLFAEAVLIAGTEEQKQKYLPKVSEGAIIGALALSEGAGAVTPKTIKTSVAGGRLTGVKLPVTDGDVADYAVVAARTGAGNDEGSISLFIVDMKAGGVTAEAVDTVDPTRSHAKVSFDGAGAEPLGAAGQGWAILDKVFDRAAVLYAFEQVGGSQAALEMARDYAMGRYAFGRPIASFQAIKHKLADMYVATELARSNSYYGAWALSTDAPELAIAAATARVSATEAYHECSKENIQVHGGMGFTWEFDCHLHYRRSKVLSLVLGSLPRWKDRLISRLEERNAA